VTISVSKHIRHRPCSSTYCNRHATQFYESLTLLFSAASPQFALHFPFDSPRIASQTPCVQYMTRTNAENHFATLSSDSVSKWYAASRRLPGCLISAFPCPVNDCGRAFDACSESSARDLCIAVKFEISLANFRRSGLKTRPCRFRAQSMTRTAAELRLRRPTCCLSSKITQASDTICPGSRNDAVPRRGSFFLGVSNCGFCNPSLFALLFPAKIALAPHPIRLLHHSQLH
jgi:hypothetical protein